MTLSSDEFRSRLPIWKMLLYIKRRGPSNYYQVYLGDKDEIFRSPMSYQKKLKQAENLGLVEQVDLRGKKAYKLTSKGLEETKKAEELFLKIEQIDKEK